MSRENIHSKIDELLELLSIHNGRLSLHAEKLSQLDIYVLLKQCIDLYDQVNLLALQGKIVAKPSVQKITPQESSSTPAPVEQMITEVVLSKNEIKAQPVEEIIEPEVVVIPEPKLPVKKEKTEDDMLSLFEKFSNQSIESIPKAISLAKRFELQGEFFNDDAEAYNSFMVELDQASSRDRAFEIYHAAREKYKWENEELRDELKVLMYRKHL